MTALEAFISKRRRPRTIFTFGDVHSALAASVVAAVTGATHCSRRRRPASGGSSVPEGVNRAAVDRLSDLSLTHSESANANLRCECASPERIHFVGNVMIGSALRLQPRWQERADRAFGELAQKDGVARCAGPRMLTSGAPMRDKARSHPDPRALPRVRLLSDTTRVGHHYARACSAGSRSAR
jgi:UDP-N-acetylglucosamine 2-epimerase